MHAKYKSEVEEKLLQEKCEWLTPCTVSAADSVNVCEFVECAFGPQNKCEMEVTIIPNPRIRAYYCTPVLRT